MQERWRSFSSIASGAATYLFTRPQTVTAASGAVSQTSAPISVSAAAASQFVLSTPASAAAGVPFSVTVTARDAFGNTATGFGGVVSITSSDPQATLPAPATLAAGVGTFTVTLRTGGNQTVTATSGASSARPT